MLVLNTRNIGKRGALYNLNADRNLTELKHIMKDLLVKEIPSEERPAVWANNDAKPFSTKSVSTQTEGGRVWAYSSKKKNTVKTFAL